MKVTGIIGVIIITFIVIIVAAFTFVHVESIREKQLEKKNRSVEGWVIDISQNETVDIDSESVALYDVTLSTNKTAENNTTYKMIFEEVYPPYLNVKLRFYYNPINNDSYLWITEIEQIE
jgi:hypothetical protein